ncbi:O-antigen translocase [Flavobacterium saliperosum]|nr:O-antigen translocase [Flavobacterium saliperosum]
MSFFRENKLIKVLSMNSFSIGINFILGIVSVRIVAQFLGPSGMALIGSFRNFTTLFKSLSTLGVNASLVRLFVENKNDKSELSKIYSTFFWIFIMISVGLGLLITLFSGFLSRLLFTTSDYAFAIRLFGLLLPFIVLNTFWIAVYNGLQQFRKIVFIQIVSSVFTFALTVSLIYFKRLEGALIATAVSDIVLLIVTLLFVINNKEYFQFDLQKIISKKYFSVIGRFSVMSLLSAIIVPLTLISIRSLLIETHSVEKAGIWDAVNRISGFYMLFFSSGLSLYYMPRLAELKTDSEFINELKNYFKTLVPLFLILVAGIFFFKDFIVNLALTREFSEVKEIIIWQLLGDLLKVMSLAFGYQILVKTMMRRYFAVEIIFNVAYFGLAYFMIQSENVAGAVKAYFFANIISFVLMLVLFRKLLKKNLN